MGHTSQWDKEIFSDRKEKPFPTRIENKRLKSKAFSLVRLGTIGIGLIVVVVVRGGERGRCGKLCGGQFFSLLEAYI